MSDKIVRSPGVESEPLHEKLLRAYASIQPGPKGFVGSRALNTKEYEELLKLKGQHP